MHINILFQENVYKLEVSKDSTKQSLSYLS